jgi:hypothetical protein
MLAVFCLRLASGLILALLVLPADALNPRFYRVQFLTALGLTAVPAVFPGEAGGWLLWSALGLSFVLSFLGSVAWSLEGAPGGRVLIILTGLTLVLALFAVQHGPEQTEANGVPASEHSPSERGGKMAVSAALTSSIDDLTSAALLGTATTAMLLGHSYLVMPTMSIVPLLRILGALFAALIARAAVAGVWLWMASAGKLDGDTLIWLGLRWVLGFILPLVLGVMAWQTARIRSTQSATGILYVVVIFCFLGELTSQLLGSMSHVVP